VCCLKQKCLILLFFLLLYLVIFPISLNAQQINKLDNVINNGEISDFNVFKTDDGFHHDTNTSTVLKKQTNAIVNSMIPIKSNSLTLKEKQIIIKVNGKKRIITIPVFPSKNNKKQITFKTKRINESLVLVRINDNTSEINYNVPISYDLFGFPIDPKDKIRCEAEKKIGEIYKSISEMNDENYVDIVNSVHRTGYEAIEKYSNYPDICAIIQLYLIESFIKMYMINDNYDSLYSTSREYFKYLQLSSQYSHLNSLNQSMKTLHLVIEKRKSDLTNNEASLIKNNQFYFNQISQYNQSLIDYKERLFNGIPSEKEKENYAKDIASIHAEICFCYAKIYENYMKMNNKIEADKIFKIEKIGNDYILSGKLYDSYKSTPYQQTYKYKYFEVLPDNSGSITKTGEVNVKLYRDAKNFLNLIKNMVMLQSLDKIDCIINGQSRNEKRTLDMCDYLNDFKPSNGSESGVAEEKITPEQLERYKKYAYAQSDWDELIDYYKRKPVIKDLYVARTTDTKLSPTEIVHPNEFLTLCAKADLSDYYKLTAPDNAFLCKVYTVKQNVTENNDNEGTPSSSAIIVASKSENELEIDRQKLITLIPDVLNRGFYAKFQVNETDSDNELPTSEFPTATAISLKKEKSKIRKMPTDEITNKNLSRQGKDAMRESICCIKNSYIVDTPLKNFYTNNKYFTDQINHYYRNILGYYNNFYHDDNTLIFNNITTEVIKSGGTQWTYYGHVGGDDNHPPIARNRFLTKNQADWLIIDTHGDPDSTRNGAIVISNPSQSIKMFQVNPWELIDNINTNYEKSKYADDVDVLILLVCSTLPWIDSDPYASTPEEYKYSKGWHKVLPEGIILGFKLTTHDTLNRDIVRKLNERIYTTSQMNKEQTRAWLRSFWKDVNEEFYNKYFKNRTIKVIVDGKEVDIENPYIAALHAALLDKKTHVSYKEMPIIIDEKIVEYKFEEDINEFSH